MSKIVRSGTVDLDILPNGLASIAKSHMRIDGTYDDYLIAQKLKSAIAWFERVTQVSVNPVTWKWMPDSAAFCNGSAPVPVSPVNSFTVNDGAVPPADISGGYGIETMSTHGVGLYSLVGNYATGMQVVIPSGFAKASAIEPGIVDILLRYTAHLYENREILVPGTDAQTPGWMYDVIATYWVPRV